MADEILNVLSEGALGLDAIQRRLAAAHEIYTDPKELSDHLAAMHLLGLVEPISLGWGVQGWVKA